MIEMALADLRRHAPPLGASDHGHRFCTWTTHRIYLSLGAGLPPQSDHARPIMHVKTKGHLPKGSVSKQLLEVGPIDLSISTAAATVPMWHCLHARVPYRSFKFVLGIRFSRIAAARQAQPRIAPNSSVPVQTPRSLSLVRTACVRLPCSRSNRATSRKAVSGATPSAGLAVRNRTGA